MGIFTISVVVLVSFIQNTPEGQRWISQWKLYWRSIQVKLAFQKDPPLGESFLPLSSLHPVNGIALPRIEKPLLIIVARGCEGCPGSSLRDWSQLMSAKTWQRALGTLLVIQDNASTVRAMATKFRWRIPVVADERGEITRALNAFFTPRAYGFIGGKLVWIQKDLSLSPLATLKEFLRATSGEEKVKRLLDDYVYELREKAWGRKAAMAVKGAKGHE